jgi:hypothetical protein
MSRFAQGKYTIKNPEKYVGNKQPTYRSSWEFTFMRTCDTHPSIQKWASEAISIPYRCPLTGRQTIYVPDFFIQYVDKNSKMHVELIEVKPLNQTIYEKVGKNKNNQMQYAKNVAKWRAAQAWCKAQGIKFRVVSENDIFSNGRSA